MARPDLKMDLSAEKFEQYYWLKAELVAFCRAHGIPVSGNKKALSDRITHFLKTGKILKTSSRKRKQPESLQEDIITLDALIPAYYKNDETHRKFFKSVIGPRFKFNIIFMAWMKENSGAKTYQDAVDQWLDIEAEKKSGKTYDIGPQFEYNRYTRAFFKANPSKTKAQAIACWHYKKSLPGTNAYEPEDLNIIL